MDAEQLRVYFPYQRVPGRDVRDLPAHFRPEIRAGRAALQMGRRPATLRRVRRARPASRWGCSISTCFRARANTTTSPQFGIIDGKLLPDGKYQRPVCALVCNFPPPQPDKPSLMSHERRGDALPRVRPRDAHDPDPRQIRALLRHERAAAISSKPRRKCWRTGPGTRRFWTASRRITAIRRRKFRAEILGQLKEARLATEGNVLSPATLLRPDGPGVAHANPRRQRRTTSLPLSNKVLSEVFLPVPPDTAFVAYFGHLMGYGAGYYGYAWADAIAADMATV